MTQATLASILGAFWGLDTSAPFVYDEADTLSWVRGVIAGENAPYMYAGSAFCARVFTIAARKFARSFGTVVCFERQAASSGHHV